ncbi:hypothetical protein NQ314_005096 [Rhamnusium bicolor]|uniref:PiggyBac transposable element-derived protein domain-containing protein n=1 Tax=Rhamnusium bicolor TaxID=1586634 RepID=A0AAV8ZKL6_9CUCU|nr:hypothetical protein NQ314_005096 [Rhamnusium bicolor]
MSLRDLIMLLIQSNLIYSILTNLKLLYLGGVLRSSHLRVSDLWETDGTGVEAFRLTMSLKRFKFLLRCLRFDDIRDRTEREALDNLAAVRKMFDEFVARCKINYVVGYTVTIDEMLEGFRGRCGFRQYIKSNPARYGLKILSMADSENYYTVNMEVYKQPDGLYVVDNSAFSVVKRLITLIALSGRNVTTDNWFSSIPLASYLLEQKLTTIGTIRKNNKELPEEFVVSKDHEQYSSLFGFQKNATIVSYVPKKGKVITLLSTYHHTNEIDEKTGEKYKPKIITFYNDTKCGVYKVDEMKGTYSVSRKSARWSLTFPYLILRE